MKMRIRKPPKPRESSVQRQALAWLELHGVPAWRRNVAAIAIPATASHRRRFIRAAAPGQSDIWGIVYDPIHGTGRHFELEIKRPGERPTLQQILWLRYINELTGGAFWVADIETLSRVMPCLMAGGKVEYLAARKRYGKTEGPTDEYDIIWPHTKDKYASL